MTLLDSAPTTRTAETWKTIEIVLTAQVEHADPELLSVDALFAHDDGFEIRRPAFWDGGATWRVRFAPTKVGVWSMVTRASTTDPGLEGVVSRITCSPYSGALEIYKRGFLHVADSGRHFEYADGTPFFYLGDTHWILPHERFDRSNAAGIDSQFRHMVDVRQRQGFTVYQSEPIWQPHDPTVPHSGEHEEPVADLSTGFDESDLPGFRNLDRKFAYIADHGLVHANAQITWVLDPLEHPEVFTVDFMDRMARYWVARYGCYPVIWTIGQEIDPDMYGQYSPETRELWLAVGRALERDDSYAQVIMPHMENTASATASASTWKDHSFHHAFGAQVDTWNTAAIRDFWEQSPPKPTVVYETRYDGFWTDTEGAVLAGYNAFQLGMLGYGYGVSGIWNDVYSTPDESPDYGTDYELPERYTWWFDGLARPAGDQLGILRAFYESMEWWRLEPRFDDASWSVLEDGHHLATIDHETYVVVLAHPTDKGTNGVLRRLENLPYDATWFDPRTGDATSCGSDIVRETGEWRIPAAPTREPWLLLLTIAR
jgi:hypothetical protein